jgi:hypothetical protein
MSETHAMVFVIDDDWKEEYQKPRISPTRVSLPYCPSGHRS